MKKPHPSLVIAGFIILGFLMFYPVGPQPIGHSRTVQNMLELDGTAKRIALAPDFLDRLQEIIPPHLTEYDLSSKHFYDVGMKLPIEFMFGDESERAKDFVDYWGRPYKLRYQNVKGSRSLRIWSTGGDGIDQNGKKDDILVTVPFDEK